MNVMNFARELSSLVIRYTKEPLPGPSSNNKQSEDVPLTKQEVMNVATNVLATLLGIGDINVNNTSFKTPTTEIAVSTPITPVVNNINPSENDGNICRSQDIQQTPKNCGTSNPDLRTDRTEEKITLDVFQDEKKFISRSSPAICVNNISRADTFVLDDQFAEVDSKIFNDSIDKTEMISAVLKFLNEAQMSAKNIVAKLDEIKKQALLSTLNMQRLSTTDINSRTSSITRQIIPPKVRKSISDFPGNLTPTSSKSLTPASKNSLNKRESFGATPVNTISRKLNSTPVTRSKSSLNLSLNQSSNKSFDSINAPTRNPKYAHVQSTIPKPISGKRNV